MRDSRVSVEVISDYAVRLSCVIARPPARVYAAWTTAAELARWFVPEPGAVCTVYEFDVREGGKFRFAIDFPGNHCTAAGSFLRLDYATKMVLSWSWEEQSDGVVSQVTLDFIPHGQGTNLVLTHERMLDRESREDHTRGWTACEISLADYLESN